MPDTTDGPENLSSEPPEPSDAADQTEDADRAGSGDPDLAEAAWQQIVAELSDLSTNLEPERTAPLPPTAPTLDFPVAPWVDRPQPPATTGRTWQRSPEAEALAEAEGEFIPPDPGFALSEDPLRNLGWSIVAGTPILVLLSFFWPHAPGWTVLALATTFLAGTGLLLWRLPQHHDNDPDGDQGGAIV